MFIVSAVNVYPSDIEFVVRGLEGVTGEYLIRITEEDFTAHYEVTIEKSHDNARETDEQVAEKAAAALKARIGVKPRKVVVLPDGSIERSTHKAKRVIDERRKEEWQREGI
jgi:phenylacetate-CoA ligase